MKQLGEVRRSQWRSRSNVSRFWSFVDESSWAVDHSLDFIKENLRRASKESIAIIKPIENKRGHEGE